MTEYTRASKALEEIQPLCESLMNAPKDEDELYVDKYEELVETLVSLEGCLANMRKKANEKDNDKKIYGPKMIIKVNEVLEKYEKVMDVLEEELRPNFEPLSLQKAAAARLAAERSERARKNEEEKAIKNVKIETHEEEQQRLLTIQRTAQTQMENERTQKEISAFLESEAEKRGEMIVRLKQEFENWDKKMINLPSMRHKTINIIFKILDSITAPNPNSLLTTFNTLLDAIGDLIGAIAGDTSDVKLRTIRLRNEKFQDSIGSHRCSLLLLRAIGFEILMGDELSDICADSSVKPMSNEPYLFLREPDCRENPEEFLIWFDTISATQKTIRQICDKIRDFRRNNIYGYELINGAKNEIQKVAQGLGCQNI